MIPTIKSDNYNFSESSFEAASEKVSRNLMAYLPEMVKYKETIQRLIAISATEQEKADIKNDAFNPVIFYKLIELTNVFPTVCDKYESLYCVAMAVGTIMKEYGWGLKYVTPEGLLYIAKQIKLKSIYDYGY